MLVISGELDNVTTPQEGKLVAEEFHDSRQYIARGAGHVDDVYAPRTSPAAKRLRRFLRNVYEGGA